MIGVVLWWGGAVGPRIIGNVKKSMRACPYFSWSVGNAGGPMIFGNYRIRIISSVWLVLWKAQPAQESWDMFRILAFACFEWRARADYILWRYRKVYALWNSMYFHTCGGVGGRADPETSNMPQELFVHCMWGGVGERGRFLNRWKCKEL